MPIGSKPTVPERTRGSSARPIDGTRTITSKSRPRQGLAAKLLRRKAATLFRNFPAALDGDEEGIHQLRVSGRRMRVALTLLAAKPRGRRASRAQRLLRQLTQTAGKGRDLDVLLEILVGRLKQLPTCSPEQRQLRRRLLSERRRCRLRMVHELLALDIARLRGDLAKLLARSPTKAGAIEHRFRSLCQSESGKLYDGFTALGSTLDVEALHALRRCARRLRYAVEVHGELFANDSDATKPWKALQEAIGLLHDHDVLAGWFETQAQADSRRGKPALAAAASMEAGWARKTMRRLHREFLRANPLALVSQGLQAAGCVSLRRGL